MNAEDVPILRKSSSVNMPAGCTILASFSFATLPDSTPPSSKKDSRSSAASKIVLGSSRFNLLNRVSAADLKSLVGMTFCLDTA